MEKTAPNTMLASQLLTKSIPLKSSAGTEEQHHQEMMSNTSSEKQQVENVEKHAGKFLIVRDTNGAQNEAAGHKIARGQTVEHKPYEVSNLSLSCSPSKSSSSSQESLNKSQSSPNKKKSDNERDLELLVRERQELINKCRKMQLEIDEKNEIINVLKDELENSKAQESKFQKENLLLLKDSKRVKFLQDENDFLQDKLANVEGSELEIKKLKEKLAEVDFLKLRITELESFWTKAEEKSDHFEEKFKKADESLQRIPQLESELNKWKSFSHELEFEKNSIQAKLLESIDQEAQLNLANKQIENEVKRLRSLIKSEEERDEEQASNSLIMNLKQDLQVSSPSQQISSIKYELGDHLQKELDEENSNLKQKVAEQEIKFNELFSRNQTICDELESNKKLVSELRKDLACEKSLTFKLSKQLTAFTKQIKNLDKQYFPMHDSTTKPNGHNTVPIVVSSTEQKPNVNSTLEDRSQLIKENVSTNPQLETTKAIVSEINNTHIVDKTTPIQQNSKHAYINNNNNNNSTSLDDSNETEDESDEIVPIRRAPTPVKPSVRSSASQQHFVRSRSVNYGSSYMDRIRATVTATTTNSSFNNQRSNMGVTQQHPQNKELVINTKNHVPSRLQSSSQFNALIDPITNEHPMNLLQNQQQHQHHNSPMRHMHHHHHHHPSQFEGSEQQIAQLATLHQQYYYHHLQHMHQLHQLHHQHHLHHQHKKQIKSQSTNINAKKTNETNNESSVWFEYGCV